MNFCPVCGQKRFILSEEKQKKSVSNKESAESATSSLLQNPPESILCTHSYEEAKATLYKDKYDAENKLICGLCHKEFSRTKVPEKKEGMANWQIATIIGVLILFMFAVLSQGSNTESGSNFSQNESSIMSQSAQSFMRPSGINSTIGAWGLSLNTSSGPRSLEDVVEDMWYYLNANSSGSGDITKEDMNIALQPGNSVYNILQSLFLDQETIDLVAKKLVDLSQ